MLRCVANDIAFGPAQAAGDSFCDEWLEFRVSDTCIGRAFRITGVSRQYQRRGLCDEHRRCASLAVRLGVDESRRRPASAGLPTRDGLAACPPRSILDSPRQDDLRSFA